MPTAANEERIALRGDLAYEAARQALASIGKVSEVDASHMRLRGHVRYGLQKVKVIVAVTGESESSSVLAIQAKGDDVWGKGARMGLQRFVDALRETSQGAPVTPPAATPTVDPSQRDEAVAIQAQAYREVYREIHRALLDGDTGYVRRLMEQGAGAKVSELDVANMWATLPWKNFWDLYVLHRMGEHICPESDVDEAAALCREAYGENFGTSMDSVLSDWAEADGDFDEAIFRHTPPLR